MVLAAGLAHRPAARPSEDEPALAAVVRAYVMAQGPGAAGLALVDTVREDDLYRACVPGHDPTAGCACTSTPSSARRE